MALLCAADVSFEVKATHMVHAHRRALFAEVELGADATPDLVSCLLQLGDCKDANTFFHLGTDVSSTHSSSCSGVARARYEVGVLFRSGQPLAPAMAGVSPAAVETAAIRGPEASLIAVRTGNR